MTDKERQQVLIGLGIWKLELEYEPRRRAKERKLIFDGRARPGVLTRILNHLRRPR
jgi:hypothetical protein